MLVYPFKREGGHCNDATETEGWRRDIEAILFLREQKTTTDSLRLNFRDQRSMSEWWSISYLRWSLARHRASQHFLSAHFVLLRATPVRPSSWLLLPWLSLRPHRAQFSSVPSMYRCSSLHHSSWAAFSRPDQPVSYFHSGVRVCLCICPSVVPCR